MTPLLLAAVAAASLDGAYEEVEARYVREFLKRHPVVSTYLGGAGLDPALAEADGALKDWSPEGLAAEAAVYREIEGQLGKIDPVRLSARHRIDREVVLHQIAFMRRQNEER
jgi:uncharacterized protein (DUF885 family)